MPNFWLGHSLLEENNYEEARKVYQFLLQKANQSFEVFGNAGIVEYRLHNLDDALFYFKKSLAIDQSNANTYYYMGDIYLQKGDLENAQRAFDQCLKRDPNFLDAEKKLSGIYQMQGRVD